jgi:hypothetical protein
MDKNIEAATAPAFKVGDYCYLDNLKKSAFSKSYEPQRLQIYMVTKVFRSIVPHQFELYDLKDTRKGIFYAAQMRRTNANPQDKSYWAISKVVRRKVVDKRVLFQCRFEGYGRKFDEDLPASRIPRHIMRRFLQARREKKKKEDEEQ